VGDGAALMAGDAGDENRLIGRHDAELCMKQAKDVR
jgi:hypothetical protein